VFNRPGAESALMPRLGIVHEWSTSEEEINNWMGVFCGIIVWLSTSSKRKFLGLSEGAINLSNSTFRKSEYS